MTRNRIRIAAAIVMVLSIVVFVSPWVLEPWMPHAFHGGLYVLFYALIVGASGFVVAFVTLTLTLYRRPPNSKEIAFWVAPAAIFFLLSDLSFLRGHNPLPHDVMEGFFVASFIWPLLALLVIGLRINSAPASENGSD